MLVRSFASVFAILICSPSIAWARSASDVAAIIKMQSQAFSDASASGDARVLARLLDDDVTFMDEDGDIGTKKEILASTKPQPHGTQSLRQTDWHVHVYGTVAVTAFTDESTAHVAGQTLKANFRSTEVWMEREDGWKMISSQTLALQVDPPAIALPSSVLREYVGTYEAGKGFDVAIARRGEQLTASLNGKPPIGLRAEVKDVFFVPGQPRSRRIFERDKDGKISRFVSRREGHDIFFRRVA